MFPDTSYSGADWVCGAKNKDVCKFTPNVYSNRFYIMMRCNDFGEVNFKVNFGSLEKE